MGVKWDLIVVLICTSLITPGTEPSRPTFIGHLGIFSWNGPLLVFLLIHLSFACCLMALSFLSSIWSLLCSMVRNTNQTLFSVWMDHQPFLHHYLKCSFCLTQALHRHEDSAALISSVLSEVSWNSHYFDNFYFLVIFHIVLGYFWAFFLPN